MNILITYDVQTESSAGQRRLRRVSRLCMNYGQRVQNSVFECTITEVQLTELKNQLETTIDATSDSIRIYFLNKSESRRTITLGKQTSFNVESPLIL